MPRPTLRDLERRAQKPDCRRLGNWMARRVVRPAALRVTWVIGPWGVSAHGATLAAWGCGLAAAAAFGWGTVGGWLAGAALLQIWYLLDHVDGQLARLRGTASLDGTQLDYLMHHTVSLLVPLGVGWGCFVRTARPWWLLAGLAWGVALLLITLGHDARYKAFVQRLKRVRGELHVVGGGGARPEPQPRVPRHPLQLAAWAARKACEMHVTMNVLSVLAIVALAAGDRGLVVGRAYLVLTSIMATAVAIWTIGRSVVRKSAEQEFAAWYRVPPGCELVFEDGWWEVRPAETAGHGQDG